MITIFNVGVMFAVFIMLESLVPLWYICMRFMAKKHKPRTKNYDYYPSVSIVIPTYNEEATIGRKLQNILEQTYSNVREVFIVDGCSNDATRAIVNQFTRNQTPSPDLRIELVKEETHGGITQAENLAFPKCNGDLICVSDSDCIWEKEALKEAVANFFDNSVGAVTGSRNLLSKQTPAEKMEGQYNSFNETLRIGESSLDSTPIFRGELALFRSSLLHQIRVGTDSPRADDSEICIKIRKTGYAAIIDRASIFHELAAPSAKSRMRQKLTRGSGLLRLFLKNLSVIFNPRKYGWYSLILASNLYMLLVSPILVLLIIVFGTILILSLPILYLLATILLFAGLLAYQYRFHHNSLLILIASFLQSQFVLLLSIPLLLRKQKRTWKQVSEIREKWRTLDEKRHNPT